MAALAGCGISRLARPRGTRTILLIICAAGVLLRLGLIFGGPHPAKPERFEYDLLARNLLSGAGYVYPHLGAPYRSFYGGVLYVWMTAAVYAMFPPGEAAMLIAQSLTSALLAGIVFLIGRRLWNDRVGLAAASLTALHPALAYYDTHKLHPLGVDALTTAAAVAALLWVHRSRRSMTWVMAGMALGVAFLQRGSLLLFVPMGCLWVWRFAGRGGWGLRRAMGCLAGFALVVLPWVARYDRIHGAPGVLTTTGEHFWIGNAPHSSGSALLPSGEPVISKAPEALLAAVRSADEAGQSRLFWRAGWNDLKADPPAFALKAARKFLAFWLWAPQTGLRYPRRYLVIYLSYYAVVAVFALLAAAMLCARRNVPARAWTGLLLVLGVLLSVSALHSLFYVEMRHRWGVEPLLLVLACIGGASLRWSAGFRWR